MNKILVATDGSKNATKALKRTKELASLLDANVTIVSVARNVTKNPYLSIQYSSLQTTEKEYESLAEKILKQAAKDFEDFEGEVRTKLLHGDPADSIVKETEENDYDLLVMGSRGLGTFSRTILGSVSHKVLNHTEASVLIVK